MTPLPPEPLQPLIAVLRSRRFRLTTERVLQSDIAAALRDAGIAFEREARLSPEDRPDFMSGGIAIEVKIKGARTKIYRQCMRYCAHERVAALILATNVSMALPPTINGRPTALVRFGKAGAGRKLDGVEHNEWPEVSQ